MHLTGTVQVPIATKAGTTHCGSTLAACADRPLPVETSRKRSVGHVCLPLNLRLIRCGDEVLVVAMSQPSLLGFERGGEVGVRMSLSRSPPPEQAALPLIEDRPSSQL